MYRLQYKGVVRGLRFATQRTFIMAKQLEEMVGFLALPSADARRQTVQIICGLTGSESGIQLMKELKSDVSLVRALQRLAFDEPDGQQDISELALKALVNMGEHTELRQQMIQENVVEALSNALRLAKNSVFHQVYIMLLANVTRDEKACEQFLQVKKPLQGLSLIRLTQLYVTHDSTSDTYSYVASVLCNVSRLRCAREIICDPKRRMVERLVGDLRSNHIVRRMGVLNLFRNCCLDLKCHDALIDEESGFVSTLLVSLMGAGNYDDDDAKFLRSIKAQMSQMVHFEQDHDIRKILLDMVALLVRRKESRTYLRSIDAYVILRELHKYEKSVKGSQRNSGLLDNIIPLFILDEEEDAEATQQQLAKAAQQVSHEEYFIRQDPNTGELIKEVNGKPTIEVREEDDDGDDDVPDLIDIP